MHPRARCSLILAFLAILGHAPDARASTFTVTSTADAADAVPGDGVCETAPGNGVCTLRAAADESEAQAPIGGDPPSCLAIPQPIETTITFAVTGTIALGAPVSFVSTLCARSTTILGPGPALLTLAGAGIVTGGFQTANTLLVSGLAITGADVGVMDYGGPFFTSSDVSLVDVTISDGRIGVQYDYSSALSLDRVTVARNSEDGIGVGSFLALFLSVSRSQIVDNGGVGVIGPIFTLGIDRSRIGGNGADGLRISGVASPVVTVTDATFDGNGGVGAVFRTQGSWVGGTTFSQNAGGGVEVQEGDLEIVSSTISGNSTPADGAGLLSRFYAGTVRLNNTTITANVADCDGDGFGDGGGVFVEAGAVIAANSIVAQNRDAGGEARDCAGSVTSAGHNVFGTQGGCLLTPRASDLVGADPRLGPLADNGGPTLTHAPLPGSPAIDHGSPAAPGSPDACASSDQRGVSRPQLAACDAGAVESTCANGVQDPWEGCDDGNTDDGDCCSPACQMTPRGGLCADEGNPCTTDACNEAGVCLHDPNTLPCDDGNPCTTGDTCAGGTCAGGPTCDPCEVCDAALGCTLPSAPGCTAALPGTSAVTVKNNAKDPRDVLRWTWKGSGPLSPSDVGRPLSGTSYTICLIDFRDSAPTLLLSSSTPADGLCDGTPCWTLGRRGFRYADRARTADGLARILLHPTLTRKGRIALKGRGGDLDLPTFPLVPPVIVRLLRSDGPQCWEATFPRPTDNDDAVFSARSE